MPAAPHCLFFSEFNLYPLAEKGKKLRSSDEQIMQRAEKLLYGEFAWVLGIEPKEVVPFIRQRIE